MIFSKFVALQVGLPANIGKHKMSSGKAPALKSELTFERSGLFVLFLASSKSFGIVEDIKSIGLQKELQCL